MAGDSVPRPIPGYAYVFASKPVMLGKFVTSNSVAGSSEPTMTYVVPVSQFLSSYSFMVGYSYQRWHDLNSRK